MIAVDDLRTQISPYPEGGAYMHTPNLAKLAARSVVFERAYVSVALCMPSRTALLTSRRPDTTRSWTIEQDQWFRNSGGANWTTLPGAFLAKGYLTMGMGKVYHETMPASDPQDARRSWSREAFYPTGGQKQHGGLYDPPGKGGALGGHGKLVHRFAAEDEPSLQDGNLTLHAVATIERMANGSFGMDVADGSRPFFLAIGFHKPHVPFWAPSKYFDLYPLANVPPVPHPNLPTNAVAKSIHDWQVRGWCETSTDIMPFCGEKSKQPLSPRYPLDNTTVSADAAAYLRQGYFASVSWTDANIGRVLDAFDAATILSSNAVIAFWGDHGWQLGDNDQWDKMTNFEHATKIPLMIACGSGGGSSNGCVGRASALVEAIDIMPTLLEEAGIPIPMCPTSRATSRATNLCSEGRSLSKLLRAAAAVAVPVTTDDDDVLGLATHGAAYSQFPRPEHAGKKVDDACRDRNQTETCTNGWCNSTAFQCPNTMGYTIRVDKYRYTAWLPFFKCENCTGFLSDWDAPGFGNELYDHSDAPVPTSYLMETVNIAGQVEVKDIEEALRAELKSWTLSGM